MKRSGNLSVWTPPRKSWFFGIGINTYVEFPDLSNAVKDVKDILNILERTYDVHHDHVYTLFNEDATEEKIIDQLDQLVHVVQPEDKLLIYYSGHGHLNKAMNVGYWIPHDAQKNKTSRYIHNSTIREYIRGIKTMHTLLISDSCFSGSLFVAGSYRSTRALDELDGIQSRWALCSGRHDEEVYDGDPGDNSPFAKSILSVLSHNKSDALNVANLANRVIEVTAANYEQLPDGRPMNGVGHEGGQYIFNKKNALLKNEQQSYSETKMEYADRDDREKLWNKTGSGLALNFNDSRDVIINSNNNDIKKIGVILVTSIVLIGSIVAGVFYLVTSSLSASTDVNITMGVLTWVGVNQENDINSSVWFNNNKAVAQHNSFGKLYKFEDAVAACVDLGQGWRLPNLEDYVYITKGLLGEIKPVSSTGAVNTIHPLLIESIAKGGDSGLSLSFAGFYDDNTFERSDEYLDAGYYWLADRKYLYMSFSKTDGSYTGYTAKMPETWNRYLSCRCVRDNKLNK